jgi:hypothetical protein
MEKKLVVRAVALAAMLAASSAALATTPQTVSMTNTVGDLWTASFGDTPTLGIFTDVIHFTPPATPGSTAWGSVVNYAFFGQGGTFFSSADLNGVSLFTAAIPGPFFTTTNLGLLLPHSVSGPLTLTIHGYSTGGSYGGELDVHMAPVPEPEHYAMLLGGLGILAMLSRRRKQR